VEGSDAAAPFAGWDFEDMAEIAESMDEFRGGVWPPFTLGVETEPAIMVAARVFGGEEEGEWRLREALDTRIIQGRLEEVIRRDAGMESAVYEVC